MGAAMKITEEHFWIAGATAVLFMVSATKAWPHDVYDGVRSPTGQLCCGGDPVTGDCEGLVDEFIKVQSDGSAVVFSKRYGAWIKIAKDTITLMTIPADKGVHAGHYCGVKRQASVPTPDQPDPFFTTYCVFLSPGGV